MKRFLFLSFVLLGLAACKPNLPSPTAPLTKTSTEAPRFSPDPAFNAYWYAGDAELTSYHLKQARYGELREGEAVLVFVTEDFSNAKQVKLDRAAAVSPSEKTSVLKMNLTKKFNTGLYPYSMMLSVFTPVSATPSLKVTNSVQEWCGHVYQQFNKTATGIRYRGFSYFEKEVEEDQTFEAVMLEDEVWTRIRLSPSTLPQGAIKMLPGAMISRLHHHTPEVVEGTATLADAQNPVYGNVPMQRYSLQFSQPETRNLTIFFEKAFPHRILGWEEAYEDGFGTPKRLVTQAIRNKELKTDYWAKNSNADAGLRQALGLN